MKFYEPYARPKRRRRDESRGRFTVFDLIVLVITLVASLMLLLSYLALKVNPNTFVLFALLGLIAPVLYITNTILMLYWVLRWNICALIPLVAMLIGAGNLSLFFRPTLGKQYKGEKDAGAFTFVSYNVMGFIKTRPDGSKGSSMDEVVDFINTFSPDVLCMQEYQTTNVISREDVNKKLSALRYNVVNYQLKSQHGGWGLALYSRYPIVRSQAIEFENSTNSVVWSDLVIGRDTVRVFNNHMQTTSIKAEDKEFIMQEILQAGDTEDKTRKMRSILRKLARNYRIRAHQADSIAPLIESSPYPVIVCGDFNDTPMSYVYKNLRGSLADAFVEKGRGMTNTYRGFFNLFRIDYVLHSPRIEVMYYANPPSNLSDHNPVVVEMKMKPNT